MIHCILPVGLLQCNCSIFGDEQTREAIVIDPGDDIEDILAIIEKHALRVTAIVITHGHIDHVMGANKLRAVTQAPVYINDKDQFLLDALQVQAQWLGIAPPDRPEVDANATEGLVLSLGNASFHVMETPGHTPGSCSVWIPEELKLVAGDTLFRDSIGRTDLPGGNSRQIIDSIRSRLLELPGETTVIPGHGPVTTIAHEREHNPFLRA